MSLDLIDKPPVLDRQPTTRLRFVPVIFANGEDDDAPGLAAAFADQEVQYEDKIYAPGEEIHILKKELLLKRGIVVKQYQPDGSVETVAWFFQDHPNGCVNAYRMPSPRYVEFNGCYFKTALT